MSLPQHRANAHCFPLDHAASKLTAPSGNHISIPIRESDRLSKKARTRLKHTEYLTTSRRRTRDLASTLPSLAKYLRVTASPQTRYFCTTNSTHMEVKLMLTQPVPYYSAGASWVLNIKLFIVRQPSP